MTQILLPILVFIFAISGAFSTVLVQAGWYDDANGAASGGGTLGNITTPSGYTPLCLVQSGSQCIIRINNINHSAYDTKAHAEVRGTTGLLKYVPE